VICVDTSVWVAYLRGRDRSLAEQLNALLDADEVALAVPVRVEILSGASSRDLARLARVLDALPLYLPTPATWQRLEAWIRVAVAAGERFGVGDLLVGAVAAENGAAVWSLDSDFRRMARLGFITSHQPAR
jgi:predicted nucleic acid-binding protein